MSLTEILKPSFRAIKYSWLWWSAQQQAIARYNLTQISSKPVTFIIGCGRSGTTILGKVFSLHPQVSYLFEPYHLWAAIDPKSDVLNLFHQVDATLLMNTSHYSERSQLRFNRLIRSVSTNQAKIVIEKTPLNALRINYIEALAPNSKFIHIVRDGVDVCCSIDKLASTNSYKIAGLPMLNQWWGVDNSKWKALIRDGTASGYYLDETHCLENHLSKGAYEWLVTLGEVDRSRKILGDRLLEVTYNTLTTNPKSTLKQLCDFLKIDAPQSWLNQAKSAIISSPPKQYSLSLPPTMCLAFNSYQQRYEFSNRAICY